MSWRCFAASAIGRGHIDHHQPCQDAHALVTRHDLLIAVVCDGAGSATHSDRGAEFCANEIIATLLASDDNRLTSMDFDWWGAVGDVRQRLTSLTEASGTPLCEFACTLVGAIAWPNGGVIFHIGDGLAIVDLEGGESVVSIPANGEYANETWFITAEDWADHLRITLFTGKVKRLALMSDGAMPFVLDRTQRAFFAGFIEPVCTFLQAVDVDTGNAALKETLSNPATHSITSDDKTLLIGLPTPL